MQNMNDVRKEALELILKPLPRYIKAPKLAQLIGISYPTIINWTVEGRILADASLDGNPIFTIETAKRLIEELKIKNRPDIKITRSQEKTQLQEEFA